MPTTTPVAIQHIDGEGATPLIFSYGKAGTISIASQYKETARNATVNST